MRILFDKCAGKYWFLELYCIVFELLILIEVGYCDY